jgi:hypothetical protein
MTDNKWRNRKVKAFRVSEALEEKIKYECERRRTDFSSFMRYERWSRFLRQPAKVDSRMQRTIHHEDAETVFRGVQGQGRA